MGILMTFVGNRDPWIDRSKDHGPVLSLLSVESFERIVLICTGSQYIERAKTVEAVAHSNGVDSPFSFVDLELESVVDYEEIYSKLGDTVRAILERYPHAKQRVSVLLDPGTPQMQTCWFLLAQAGVFPARLLQGVPAKFAGGAYRVREIDLKSDILPRVTPVGPVPINTDERSGIDTRSFEEDNSREKPEWITSAFSTELIGESEPFNRCLETAHRVSQYDINILIEGETGTGKELIARFIHASGTRSRGPFLPINCAALSSHLVESELFGHAKGSFTGATDDRIGQFRAAQGGTVFLDEIGELPLETQPKLLRALENRRIIPVGKDEEVEVDVRVIAATNRDLTESVAGGGFRRDLFERLNQMSIRVPPLRERLDDIPLLIKAFVDAWNRKYRERKGLSAETIRYLNEYPWPGNVRELQNAVTSICAVGMSSLIGPELLPRSIAAHFNSVESTDTISAEVPDDGLDLRAMLHNIEKMYYERALEKAGGNKTRAAELLRINPPAFRKAWRERFETGSAGERT